MKWKEMGYIFSQENTDSRMKNHSQGGFSSKKNLGYFSETGSEARTHRPSLSSTFTALFYKYIFTTRGGKS